jgi:hypothetical protein
MSIGPWSRAEILSMTDIATLKHVEKQYTAEARDIAKRINRIKDPSPGQIERMNKDAREYQSLSVEASRRIAILKASSK